MSDEVRLRAMTHDEFAGFRAWFVEAWADDLRIAEDAGDDAVRRATAGTDTLLPAGPDTPGESLYVVLAGTRRVGTAWLSVVPGERGHVSDIAIDEAERGRGYGRRTLELLEQEALRHGATMMGLNVFAHNPRAQRLYERTGYKPVAINMRKPIAPPG